MAHNMNSPTTAAATSGLKLNDPSLPLSMNVDQTNTVKASININNAALPNGFIDGGAMRGDSLSAAAGADHDFSHGMSHELNLNANSNSHSHQHGVNGNSSSSRAAQSTATAGTSLEKENLQPSMNDMGTEPHRHGEPSKQDPSRRGLVRNGLTRNDSSSPMSRSSLSESSEDSLEGVRLCYFDENNVMGGAVNSYGQSVNQNQYDTQENQQPVPVQYANNQYANQCNDDEEDEGEYDDVYDDDISEASGGTVVHNDIPSPPKNATKEELKRYYWEICYGAVNEDNIQQQQSMDKSNQDSSVMKSAPAKSCLSTNKKRSSSKPPLDSMTPRRILHHTPPCANPKDPNNIMRPSTPTEDMEDTTPINNITRLAPIPPRTQSAVKFGNNSAAEFDFLQPITEMTPIPSPVVQKIFPIDVKETEKDIEEAGVSRETARNVAALAAWDDDFDSIICEDDGNVGSDGLPKHRRGKKRGGTPYKQSGQRRKSSASVASRPRKSRSPRKSRRESLLFSRERRSLVEMEDKEAMEMDDSNSNDGNGRRRNGGNLLPFSVTIDPEEYTSPSSTSVADSVSTLGTPAALSSDKDSIDGNGSMLNATEDKDGMMLNNRSNQFGPMRRGRDSLDSACISPSSFRSSDCNSSTGSKRLDDASMSTNNREHNGANINVRGRQSNASNTSRSTTSTMTTSTGKDTPNSARTSSSTIIRAIHASGALLTGNSPPQSGLGGVTASSCPENGDGGNSGLLRPNQLKYSPSSSSNSGGSSGSSTVRMDISPSSSESLGSDIMGLLAHQSLDDSFDDDANGNLLTKQLTLFSAHPTQPFHTSISDMMKLVESSSSRQNENKDLLAFMNEHVLRGFSPSTSLMLIANKIDGASHDSKWPHYSLFDENRDAKYCSTVQKIFESILLKEIERTSSSTPSSTPCKESSTSMTDADAHTVGSCIRLFHDVSCMDWSSMELGLAMGTLRKLQEWAKIRKAQVVEGKAFVSICCKKLGETLTLTMQKVAKSNFTGDVMVPGTSKKEKLTLRKRKVQSEIESELNEFKTLEHQLASEASRHDQTKRAKRMFDAHFEMEQWSPISMLSGEIRASVIPAPITLNISINSDFKYTLLDGAAEIVMKMDGDNDDDSMASGNMQAVSLGCFMKDGGPSIQLLQAILLGSIDMKLAEKVGPFPLRKSITSMVFQYDRREDLTQQMTHLFSRIDLLIRSVKDLEMNGFCTVNASGNGDVTLSVSMSREGVIVKVGFLFRNLLTNDWSVGIFPDDVTVSIIFSSAEIKPPLNQSELQIKARSILEGLKGSSADPILLRRICVDLMENVSDQEACLR